MKFVCIVAEYNPLHLGHVYHLMQSRAFGDVIVVIMGGDFCQRGLSATLDKYTRATHAIRAGADVVVELPTLYCVNCAEQFARGAARILDALPDSGLSFGSECGDVEVLRNTAALLDIPEVNGNIKQQIATGKSFPAARQAAMEAYAADHNICIADVTLPNNILALEYIRAVGAKHPVYTVQRTSAYHSDAPTYSSSYVRQALSAGISIDDLVPDYVARDLQSATPAQEVLYLAALRAHDKGYFEGLLDAAEGLQNRIWQSAMRANTLSQAIEDALTKRYTRARVARLFTAALLDLRHADLALASAQAPYFNVLAVREDKTHLLGELARHGKVYTTQAELVTGPTAATIDARAHDTYRLLHAQDVPQSVRIVKT